MDGMGSCQPVFWYKNCKYRAAGESALPLFGFSICRIFQNILQKTVDATACGP